MPTNNKEQTGKLLTMGDIGKATISVMLMAIFALLGWISLEVQETSKEIVAVKGAQDLTNQKIGYLQRDISGLPKKENLVVLTSKLDDLKKRVTDLEGWVVVMQRAHSTHSPGGIGNTGS